MPTILESLEKHGRAIAFYNFKGGVGKTTMVTSIAYELAKKNYRVLVVDADPQMNTTSQLIQLNEWNEIKALQRHRNHNEYQGTIRHFFRGLLDNEGGLYPNNSTLNGESFKQVDLGNGLSIKVVLGDIEITEIDRLLFIKAGLGDNPEYFARVINNNAMNPLNVFSRLRSLISGVRNERQFDLILIDCPPSFSSTTICSVFLADHLVIPVNPDLFSIQGLNVTGILLKRLSSQYQNIHIAKPLATIINNCTHEQSDLVRTLVNKTLQTQNDRLGAMIYPENFPVLKNVLHRSQDIADAVSQSKLVQQHTPQSTAAVQVCNITQELLEINI